MAEIDATPAELLTWAEEAKSVVDGGLPEYEMRKATVVVALLRSAAAPQPGMRAEGEADDPTASAEWNAGCDFAMTQLCAFLSVDPATVSWDAATETVDGDVMAVIGNILHAKFGEDWCPAPPKPVPDAMREALIGRLEKGPYPVRWKTASPLTEEDRQDIVAILSETAPVPPPDGAAEVSYNPKLVAEIKSADAAEPEAKFSNAKDMLDWLSGPSDDVRSTLATAREEIVLTIAFLGRDAGSDRIGSTITSLIARLSAVDKAIITALRSAPVSAPAAMTISKAQLSEGIKWIDWGDTLTVRDEMRQLRKAVEQMFCLTLPTDCPPNLTEEICGIIETCRIGHVIGAECAKAIYGAVAKYAGRAPAVGVTRERDIARCLRIIEGAYDFESRALPLKNCGEWKYLKRLLGSPVPDATVSDWQLVPKEPTPEMVTAAPGHSRIRETWRKMLAAAPPSPQHVGREAAVSAIDDQDPPMKWLIDALRQLARDLLADPKTPWIGERDPKLHICWTAADRMAAAVSARDAVVDALRPFASFGRDESGQDIRDGLMRDRICDWFGPSDFEAAQAAIRSLAGAEP